jgi:hypothetical protein
MAFCIRAIIICIIETNMQISLASQNAMNPFIQIFPGEIKGRIDCFDRIIFKGYLPLGWPDAMVRFLNRNDVLIKDFGKFVDQHTERIVQHAKDYAQKFGRPYREVKFGQRKEELAREIAKNDHITEGLVAVFWAMETGGSFKVAYGEGKPKLVNAPRKQRCLYYYFIDRKLGWIHVRIQTYFPMTLQIYANGHEILARKMDKHGIEYHQIDNAFHHIDPKQLSRAQRFADRIAKMNWPKILEKYARLVNPLLRDLLKDMTHYWVADQVEYATDLMFDSPATLQSYYQQLVNHATLRFSAEDVLTFLGRKLSGNFQGEVLNDYKKRLPGARVKHRMKNNWIKMYDKHGQVLRIETVINRPCEFKVRREVTRNGERVMAWAPMRKGVGNLWRYVEVSRRANDRYLAALAMAIPKPDAEVKRSLENLGRSVKSNGRSHRGFNPLNAEDRALFLAISRGEHCLNGLTNRSVCKHLYANQQVDRRISNRVSRLLKRLHVHGLIAKIPRSRRWKISEQGQRLIDSILNVHEGYVTHCITKKTL